MAKEKKKEETVVFTNENKERFLIKEIEWEDIVKTSDPKKQTKK